MKKNCEVIFIQEQKMIRNFKTFTIRKKIEKKQMTMTTTDFEVLYKKLLIFKSQIFKEQGKEQNKFKIN